MREDNNIPGKKNETHRLSKDVGQTRDMARRAHMRGDWEQAEKLYRRLIEEEKSGKDIANLGALLRSTGRAFEALSLYKRYIYNQEEIEWALILNATNCAIELNESVLAGEWVEIGLMHHGENKELVRAKARVEKLKGNLNSALAILLNIINEEGQELESHLEIGKIYYEKEMKDESLKYFLKARDIDATDNRGLANAIRVANEVGRHEVVKELVNTASREQLDSDNVQDAIGFNHLQDRRYRDSYNIFNKLCKKSPDIASNWVNLVASLRGLKLPNKAYKVIRKAYMRHGQSKQIQHSLVQCLTEVGKHEQAGRALEFVMSNYDLNENNEFYNIEFIGEGYKIKKSSEMKELALRWEAHQNERNPCDMWKDNLDTSTGQRKLKIGYFSSDFCDHPVGRFIYPILREHSDAVDVLCLSTGKENDELTEKIKSLKIKWIDLSSFTDIEIARRISNQGVDILVELGGYTSGSKISALTYKPAKVQLSYLGYFAPTYLKSIDGWIGDKILFGNLNQVEKSAHRLDFIGGGYMAYSMEKKEKIRDIKGRNFTFGCFNHSRKLTSETIEVFCKILILCKNSILILKSISFNEDEEIERINKCFTARGIPETRLKLLKATMTRREHLDLYNEIDIALDPMPYGGATTSCEALSMGIPIVTYAGKGMVSRLTASILYSADLEQWIANTLNDYIEIAVNSYKRGARDSKIKRELQNKIRTSPLANVRRVSHELERIYYDYYKDENKSSS